jgi:hypothetical protein
MKEREKEASKQTNKQTGKSKYVKRTIAGEHSVCLKFQNTTKVHILHFTHKCMKN